jgi:hypothetical protein
MSERNINTRIMNKPDTEANWLKATTFIPMQGEIIVYDIEVDKDGNTLALPEGRTTPYTYERLKIGDGKTVVSDLPFYTADTTDVDDKLQTLWDWYQDETYEVMTGTLSMSPDIATYEIGSSNNVTFSWEFSKLPTEITFDGEAQIAATSGSVAKTVTSNSHATKTYSLYGKYVEGETVNVSKSISFRNKYYYGYKADPSNVDSDFIKGLGNSNWASAKTISFTPNCTSGNYVWYAYPKRFNTSQMWLGGFQGGFEEPLTVPVTNNSGFTEDYYVYRSVNTGIGSLKVEAK